MWLGDLVDRFFAPIHAINGKCKRAADRLAKVNCYELRGSRIIKWKGRFRSESSINVESITRWWIVHEMVFDIVLIEMADGSVVQWLDTYNDLLGILWGIAGTKWRDHDDDA